MKHEISTSTDVRCTGWTSCANAPWYPSLQGGGIVAYRIWQQFDGLRWFQRHEWKSADGTTDMENWINGTSGWCVGSVPAVVNAEGR